MGKISVGVRKERVTALAQGPYSLEGLADELNARRFTNWRYDNKPGQHIFDLECGLKITCYTASGSVLVQGRSGLRDKHRYMSHLRSMLPPHTVWQVN